MSAPNVSTQAQRLVEGIAMVTEIPSPAGSFASCEIRIVNDMSEVSRVADLVDRFGAAHELANEVVVALNVSLDEILNNIICYAYEDTGRHEITVRLQLRHGSVEAVVEDDGKPFDPLAVATPRPRSAGREGGVGLHFLRSLTDQLKYTRRDGINQLWFMKKLTR
jgi:serine/threonine-protein kinase RsbW